LRYVLNKRGRIESDAEYFDYIVRELHGFPELNAFKDYGVASYVRSLSPFGAGYKISQVIFKDGSVYNVGGKK
jgi:hypothetical protein